MIELTQADTRNLVSITWQRPVIDPCTIQHGRLLTGSPCGQAAYEDYCYQQWSIAAGYQNGLHMALNTSQELKEFILYLSVAESMTRHEMSMYLEQSNNTESSERTRDNTINLALRILLMLRFGPVMGEMLPRRHLSWKEGCLKDFIQTYLEEDAPLGIEGVRLPRTFNAWSLVAIGGIAIELTDNLADHLLLIEEENNMKVLIFHHASFLECHRSSMFPEGFLEETLETLALIFPESEFGGFGRFKRRRWSWLQNLLSKQPCTRIDSRLGACGTLPAEARRIERFKFWRNRLVVLKQAYDDATPRTISQWWYDRRNRVVWCTFWLAILVLVLGALVGIVQCVQGGLQVSKA